MAAFLVPCIWSILLVIGLVIYLSNPFKAKIDGGYLWHNIAYVLLPQDYYQLNDAQKIDYWKTGNKWRKRRTMRAIIFTPLIWVGGFLLVTLGSMINITPAVAEQPTSTPAITMTAAETLLPTITPTATITRTPAPTSTATQIPPTQTPRNIYIHQTVVVDRIIPVVITAVSTVLVSPTPGPTQTPWIVTVIVTATYTSTPTETPTP